MAEILSFIFDCRECPDFLWDFNIGEFNCNRVKERQIEDLHLIPEWCPLTLIPSFNRLGRNGRVIKKVIE
jgi:hypothetical protein